MRLGTYLVIKGEALGNQVLSLVLERLESKKDAVINKAHVGTTP